MLDPDAPSYKNPIAADWLHWGYYDIRGEELKNGFSGSLSNKARQIIGNLVFTSSIFLLI